MPGLPLGWDDASSRPTRGFGFHAGAPAPGGETSLISDDSDAHLFVCGATGSGKGRAFAIPALLDWPGGVIAVDVKGELYRVTARHRRTLGPVVAIDPFQEVSDGSGAFNPLSGLDPEAPTFVDDIYALASLFADPHAIAGKDGRFWDDWGVDIIASLAAHVAWCPEETDRSFGRIYDLLHTDDTVYGLAVLLDTVGKHPFTQSTVGPFLSLPDVTRGGIISTFGHQTRLLASPTVRASLASNSLDPDTLRSGAPFTIYLVWPPDKVMSHSTLLRLFLTSLTGQLMRRRHKPRLKTLMLIDEAAQIGAMPALVAATTLGRGYGIRIAWMLQSYSQLRRTYPADHEAILENAGTALTFGKHPSYSMSRTLSELVFGDMSPEALFALRRDQVMLRKAGEATRIARKLDYLHDPLFVGRFDPNPLHQPLAR